MRGEKGGMALRPCGGEEGVRQRKLQREGWPIGCGHGRVCRCQVARQGRACIGGGGRVWTRETQGRHVAHASSRMRVGCFGPARKNSGIFDLFKHFQNDLNGFGQKKVLQTLKKFK
jgi:hypothetical protein